MKNGYKLWQMASIDSKQDRQLSQLCLYYSYKQKKYQKQMLKMIQNNLIKYNSHPIAPQYIDQTNKPVKPQQSNQGNQLFNDQKQQLNEQKQQVVIKQLQQYIEQKEKCYKSNSYHYILVINLICYKIYPMIVQRIMPQINQSNPFILWINNNSSSRTVPLLQSKINLYQQYYNKNQVQTDIKKFLLFEYHFFNASKI